MKKKRILIISEELDRLDVWKEVFEFNGFEVKICRFFDFFDFSKKSVDLIVYDVDVVKWTQGVHRVGWRIGFKLFKEKEAEINIPIIFCSLTMFIIPLKEEEDYQFQKYVEKKGNLCINYFETSLKELLEMIKNFF